MGLLHWSWAAISLYLHRPYTRNEIGVDIYLSVATRIMALLARSSSPSSREAP